MTRSFLATVYAALLLAAPGAMATATDGNATDEPEDTAKLELSADTRLRYEAEFEVPGKGDRHRSRVRFRASGSYRIEKQLEIGARVTTGSRSDPRSPHQTLGNAFERFELNLDRVYVTFQPEAAPGLSLTGGKFAHPFWRNPTYGELVWDADVQPEGAMQSYSAGRGSAIQRFNPVLGQYILLEQSGDDDVVALVGQISTRIRFQENVSADLAAGYYHYTPLSPNGTMSLVSRNRGNALQAGGAEFASRFSIFNPILALTYKSGDLKVVASGEYVVNTEADVSGDRGGAIGGTISKGHVKVWYQWQRIEQDAVFSLVTQDDFRRATNFQGSVFGLNYTFTRRAALKFWALATQPLLGPSATAGDTEWRARADLNLRFP